MAKIKIEFDRETCIGARACNSLHDELWKLADDGKVDLKGSTFNPDTKKFELILDTDDEVHQEVVGVCPVKAITVTKIE